MISVNKGDLTIDGDSHVVMAELCVLFKALLENGLDIEDITYCLGLVVGNS